MASIRKLDQQTINSIAAGEVVERPASVAKELIENALDAGASTIRLSLENGGIKKLSCLDDGRGMGPQDARMALESHATSKLVRTEDLAQLQTMGFRGEALPSIASVARVELCTRRSEDREGSRVVVEGGERTFEGSCGMSPGTLVVCRDLFFNTPARYKFLRSDASETGAVAAMAGKIALTRPDVSFRLDREGDGRELLYTPGDNKLLSAIYAVFGNEAAQAMVPVAGDGPPVHITGFMTGPAAGRHNRSRQVFIVNGRVVTSPVLRSAVDEACKTWFMKGRFPQLVLNLLIPGNLIDVNVHPQKTEVRFWEDRTVFRSVYHAVRATLEREGQITRPPSADQVPSPGPGAVRPTSTQLEVTNAGFQHFAEKIHQEGAHVTVREDRGFPVEEKPALSGQRDDPAKEKEAMDSLLRARLIGSFLNTYILLESGDSLILIDQHAAHERILYEELLMQRQREETGRLAGQTLLTPVRVEVSGQELALIEEVSDYLQELGFDYQLFGDRSIALRAVPAGRSGTGGSPVNPAAALRAALDTLASARQTGRSVDETELLHQVACHAAVKAHDRLSVEEIEILIERLVQLTNPYHCPHGRPVALRFSRSYLEKLFGRIV